MIKDIDYYAFIQQWLILSIAIERKCNIHDLMFEQNSKRNIAVSV